jgi:uncharacterized protein involved in exopolysaccharide biosynthesis
MFQTPLKTQSLNASLMDNSQLTFAAWNESRANLGADCPMNYSNASGYPRSSGGYDGSNDARAKLGLGDWAGLLWREKWLMMAVFSFLSLLGVSFAMTLEKEYTASARISVLLGDEYIFTPRVGAAGEGSSPKQEQIVQSEVEILTSAQVAERVVRSIGLPRLFDAQDIKITQGPDTPDRRIAFGVANFQKKFGASATPNTTVIRLGYSNRDPDVAAAALNKLIDEYLGYRREVLFEDRTGSLTNQRNEFEVQLQAVQQEITSFMGRNGVADFESERGSVQSLLAGVRADLLSVQVRQREAQGRWSSTDESYRAEPEEKRISFESDNSRRRIELASQLADLQTRYTDDSQPVRDAQRRIEALDQVLNSEAGQLAGNTKTGVNPIRETLATDRARNLAEMQAMTQREAVLAAQEAQLQARAVQLSERRPEFEELLRRKAILEEQVKQFSTREASARAQNELSRTSNDNIRVIERANVPTRGQSLKRYVALGALAFAGLTALMAGLVRAFSRSGFPTPASVGRTLGMPVLAMVTR